MVAKMPILGLRSEFWPKFTQNLPKWPLMQCLLMVRFANWYENFFEMVDRSLNNAYMRIMITQLWIKSVTIQAWASWSVGFERQFGIWISIAWESWSVQIKGHLSEFKQNSWASWSYTSQITLCFHVCQHENHDQQKWKKNLEMQVWKPWALWFVNLESSIQFSLSLKVCAWELWSAT